MALQKPQRSEMENTIYFLHGGFQNVALQNIAPNIVNLETWVFSRMDQIFHATTNKIIVDNNFAHIFLEKSINRM